MKKIISKMDNVCDNVVTLLNRNAFNVVSFNFRKEIKSFNSLIINK